MNQESFLHNAVYHFLQFNRFLNCLIQEHNSIHKMIHTTSASSLSQQESVIRSIIDEYDKPRYTDNCAEYFDDIVEAYKSFKSTWTREPE